MKLNATEIGIVTIGTSAVEYAHCAAAADVAARMRTAARDLAARVEAGVMAAADADDRCELRRLSLDLLEMADLLDGGAP